MFDFNVTQEMVDAIPEDQRGPWQQMLDGQALKAKLMTELVAERKFAKALTMTGSEKRADLLVTWDEAGLLTDDDVRELLTDFWTVTEAWTGDDRLRDGMYSMLRRVAPLYDESGKELLEKLNAGFDGKLVELYRGNLGGTPRGVGGWTTSRETAERFARQGMSVRGMFLGMYREDGVPSVWAAYGDTRDALGVFNDRDEEEFVFEADDLENLRLIAQATGKEQDSGHEIGGGHEKVPG